MEYIVWQIIIITARDVGGILLSIRPCASHSLPQLSASLLMPKRSYFRSKSRYARTYRRSARMSRLSRISNIKRLAFRSNQQLSTVTKSFKLVDAVTMTFAGSTSCSAAVNSWVALSYDLVF